MGRVPGTVLSRLQGAASRYVDAVDPVILARARQHGVTDDDMLHAHRPIRVFALDDLVMLIGADTAGRPVEIGLARADGVEFIVHAMPARPRCLR